MNPNRNTSSQPTVITSEAGSEPTFGSVEEVGTVVVVLVVVVLSGGDAEAVPVVVVNNHRSTNASEHIALTRRDPRRVSSRHSACVIALDATTGEEDRDNRGTETQQTDDIAHRSGNPSRSSRRRRLRRME